MQKFRICVVGVGAWGSNHVKSLISMNHSVGCVDQNQEKLIEIKTLFPSIKYFSRIEDTFKEKFDGKIIFQPSFILDNTTFIKHIRSGYNLLRNTKSYADESFF